MTTNFNVLQPDPEAAALLIDNPGPVELANIELDWTPVFAADEMDRLNG